MEADRSSDKWTGTLQDPDVDGLHLDANLCCYLQATNVKELWANIMQNLTLFMEESVRLKQVYYSGRPVVERRRQQNSAEEVLPMERP